MFLSSSVDPVTVHLAIILLGCGIAYWVRATLGEMNGAVFLLSGLVLCAGHHVWGSITACAG